MHSSNTMLLLLLICLYINAIVLALPSQYVMDGGEKLQIEGTVRNVDEWKLTHKVEPNENRGKFNTYWARLNWGSRAIDDDWQEPRRTSPRVNWNKMGPQQRDSYENHETVGRIVDSNVSDQNNPEVEMIDPSKVSDQLANLKFMRYEKQIMQKDI